MSLEYLSESYADLDERIDNIRALNDVNEELVKIARNNLQSLRTDVVATGRNQGILNKIDRQLTMFEQVARIPELTTKFPIIREQMVVLIIGTLEVFGADIFRRIGDNDPHMYIWHNPKENISIEPSLLSDDFRLGDIILGHLRQRGASFQDLGSFLRTLETYLGVSIQLSTTDKDTLILGAAYRNVIVHNRSIIDASFINQIRDTSHATTYHNQKGEKIEVDDDFIDKLANCTKDISLKIVADLMQRGDT